MQNLLHGLRHMAPSARRVLEIALILSCVLMTAALGLLLTGHPYSPQTHHLYVQAVFLQRLVLLILFLASFLSAALQSKRG